MSRSRLPSGRVALTCMGPLEEPRLLIMESAFSSSQASARTTASAVMAKMRVMAELVSVTVYTPVAQPVGSASGLRLVVVCRLEVRLSELRLAGRFQATRLVRVYAEQLVPRE